MDSPTRPKPVTRWKLTPQMVDYLVTLRIVGHTRGYGFKTKYDSTRKSLIKRGLIVRAVAKHTGRADPVVTFHLTDEGRLAALDAPLPVDSDNYAVRELVRLHARLAQLKKDELEAERERDEAIRCTERPSVATVARIVEESGTRQLRADLAAMTARAERAEEHIAKLVDLLRRVLNGLRDVR